MDPMRFRLPLGPTVAELVKGRKRLERLLAKTLSFPVPDFGPALRPVASRLVEQAAFGDNPGGLRMLYYVPPGLRRGAPLVVVLHGCVQTADGYDIGTGWTALADQQGFAVLLPEQRPDNNERLCFNWFEPGDARRDQGEARSIRQMIDHMVVNHGLDQRRVFINGLSAGGAMTSVMLATYPETFAGGAIIAGLPYGVAENVRDAIAAMHKAPIEPGEVWADKVRGASAHRGPWPSVSVWHGAVDEVVSVTNATAIVRQWCHLHGIAERVFQERQARGVRRRSWKDARGRPVIEFVRVDGLGHGTPIDPSGRQGGRALGQAGPFLIDVGVNSTRDIARFWGICR